VRVLHVYSGNLYGGIEVILASIARAARAGANVRHEFALSFEGRLSCELADAGATVHQLGSVRASQPRRLAAARRRLADLLARGGIDRVICHAPWSAALFGSVARRQNVPLVFWAHDAMSGRHWTERLARRIVPDLVICNSHYTAGTLPALYPGVNALVVYAPVGDRSVVIDRDERRAMRAALETDDASVVIIQASRSEAWKGHAVVIDALAAIRDVPGWTWWQVGGAQRSEEIDFLDGLREQAKTLKVSHRVRWLGERADVPRLLAAADIYCQANVLPEPFGVVFIEALAAGLPVVASRLGGASEIVDDSCGVLVPASDANHLTAALLELIEDADRRRALGRRAPERARQLCTPSTELAKLDAALDSLRVPPVPA
jgi:glycosyltransferase involved in cell wall biosynthesis